MKLIVCLFLFITFHIIACASKSPANVNEIKGTSPSQAQNSSNRIWVDESLIKNSLNSGITYPANKSSVIDHLKKFSNTIPAMDFQKLQNIPEQTYSSADEVMTAALK